jgi:hypothetical protein
VTVFKIYKKDVVAARARVLLAKMDEVAAEVKDGRLTPFAGRAIGWDGEPVCAFGHAAARAAKELGVVLYPTIGNYSCLTALLDVEFESPEIMMSSKSIFAQIAKIDIINDTVFSYTTRASASTEDRAMAARVIADAASNIRDEFFPTQQSNAAHTEEH